MDPLAVHLAMREAVEHMRAGRGPTLIEADTYRFFHQNGPFPGSAFRYRSKEEEAAWRERDPVRQIGDQLVRRGLLTPERVAGSAAEQAGLYLGGGIEVAYRDGNVVDLLKADLAQAQAALARDQAAQRQAELNLSYTSIVSPVNGVVGNHVQMFVALSVISALKDYFMQFPYPVVFDHFGQPKAPQGVGQPGFANLLELIKSGHAYVKISGAYRVSTQAPAYADATALAQALVAANPDRIVWGTDWPHPNGASARSIAEIATPFPIDDGLLLNELTKWVPDAATRKKILVDNPARLYGFEPVAG
jgi:hypothetical protein